MTEWMARVLALVAAVRTWQRSSEELAGVRPSQNGWERAVRFHGLACHGLEEALRQLDLSDEESGVQDVEF